VEEPVFEKADDVADEGLERRFGRRRCVNWEGRGIDTPRENGRRGGTKDDGGGPALLEGGIVPLTVGALLLSLKNVGGPFRA
jgi:hypothetical protein